MNHVDAVQSRAVQRYLLSELSGQDLARFEEHLFSCADCANDLRESYAFVANLRAVLRDGQGEGPGKWDRIREWFQTGPFTSPLAAGLALRSPVDAIEPSEP